MGMNLNHASGTGDDEPEVMMEINTTPLIDVMLVLIIMLIITIPVQLHSVNLSLPTGKPPAKPPEIVKIDIDFDGTLMWNEQLLPSREALQSKLRSTAALPDQPQVQVRPNKLVEYKFVAQVLSDAQRLGVTRLGMVSAPARKK
jgi:biopolymer transport protein ExbD